MNKYKIFAGVSILILILLIIPTFIFYPAFQRFSALERVKMDEHFTVLLGYGSNSGVLVSDTDEPATLIIDTKIMGGSEALSQLVGEMHQGGPIYVVNTHYHSDHTGGNAMYKGETIMAGAYPPGVWEQDNKPAAAPTEWITDRKELKIGSETVIIENVGQAHTYADLVIYLKNRKVLFTGDLVFNGWHPVLRKESGADTEKWNAVLLGLLEKYTIARLVPGHGPIHDGAGLIFQSAYFARINNALEYADSDERLEAVEKQYAEYFALPFTSGFDQSVEYIRQERANQ